MTQRFAYAQAAPGIHQAMYALEDYLHQCSLEPRLIHLVKLRASQVNECAYCIDMHWKDLRALGEHEPRLYSLDAWRECPYYSDRERAALDWAEAVTFVAEGHVPDEVYDQCRRHFDDRELSNLTLLVATINAWNRLSIASRLAPGSYVSTLAAAR